MQKSMEAMEAVQKTIAVDNGLYFVKAGSFEKIWTEWTEQIWKHKLQRSGPD